MTRWSSSELRTALSSAGVKRFGVEHRLLDETGSTNDDAAAWSRAGAPHGALVVADAQRGGRGRQGRGWASPPGEGIYASLVLRPPIEPMQAPPLTLAIGLALLDATRVLGAETYLKWPNDLLADEPDGSRRKLAGVLTEMATSGMRIEHVVVGIGLNVGAAQMPPAVQALATSLRRVTGRDHARPVVLAVVLAAIERRYADFVEWGAAATVRAWKSETRLVGQRVTLRAGDQHQTGVVEDLDDEGALHLRDDVGRLHRLWAGDLEPAATPAPLDGSVEEN